MSFAKSGVLIGFGVGVLGLVGVSEINNSFHTLILWVGGFFIVVGIVPLLPSVQRLRMISRVSRGKLPLRIIAEVSKREGLVPTHRVPHFEKWLLDNVRAGSIVLSGECGPSRTLEDIPPAHFDTYGLVIQPFGGEARTTGPGGGAFGDVYAEGCFFNIQANRSVYRLLREANADG